MILTVFRPKRTRNGKAHIARSYRGRYRLEGEEDITDIPLYTTDKHVARERLEKIVREKQLESVGILPPERDDLHLDAEQPFVNVRPSTTKNHKQAIIALHADVVEELRKLPLSPGKVFANGLPKIETFKRDLRRAGIDFIDAKGRRADFHSLRHTLGTNLALAGIAPRVAMEAMRHSDIRLTTKTYTDTGLLPVADALAKLPSFTRSQAKDSQRDSQSLPRASQAVSIPVIKIDE